jgi:large subunit ribosomal protein L25
VIPGSRTEGNPGQDQRTIPNPDSGNLSMATARLGASARINGGKGAARALRREGRVPAVIYGHGREPQALSVATRELEKLLSQIAAGSTVIELDLDGRGARTLIREIQRHPVKRSILHVDFLELVAGERISVRVPLVYVGTPEGVRVGGGMLDQVLHEVEIEADPADIPNHIDVDVSAMQIAQALHVGDLPLPAGVTALDDAALTVCTVQAPRVEEAAAEEPTGAEPEVIRKAKLEEGAE